MKQLTPKNILIDSILSLIYAVIQFYGSFALLFLSFGFYTCGNEYLHQWNNLKYGFFISCIVIVFQLILTYKLYRSRTIIIRISFLIITSSSILPFLILGKETFSYSNYYEKFDEKKWKSQTEKPITMIRTFYDDQRFIGKT